ncbi:MAG: DsbA family protein [Steroidobacteraceae bacterium]
MHSMQRLHRAPHLTLIAWAAVVSVAASMCTWATTPVSVQPSTPAQGAGEAPTLPACAQSRPRGETVACVGGHAISIEELDRTGGHALHEALEQLYRQRTLALYQTLSQLLLTREAQARHLSVEKLLEINVDSRTPAVSEDAVAEFLKERTGSSTADPQRTQQASSYLTLRKRAERKREYVESLFKRYDVHVNLATPPPAPFEAIRGPEEPALGPQDAPIKLVVFSDYLCPYCRALSHTLDELLERYPKDVRVIYRHFPIHPQADRLAQAAQCAQEQGQFAAFHRALFERSSISLEELRPLAEQVGLDRAAFSSCLDSDRFRARVEQDLGEGTRLVINGTPTVFLNGERLEGNQSLEALSVRIEALHPAHSSLAPSESTRLR